MNEITWNKVLSQVKQISASIECLLRSVKVVGIDNDILKIEVYYKFHKDKLEENKTRKLLEDNIIEILGKDVKVEYVLTERKTENIMNVAEQMFS